MLKDRAPGDGELWAVRPGRRHYLRNELAWPSRICSPCSRSVPSSAPIYVAFGVFALALIYQAQGRGAEAVQVVETISTYLQETEHRVAYAIAEAFRVELAIRQGSWREALRLSKGLQFDIRPPRWYFYVPQLTQCKLLLAEGTPESLAGARIRLAALDAYDAHAEPQPRAHRRAGPASIGLQRLG